MRRATLLDTLNDQGRRARRRLFVPNALPKKGERWIA